MKKLAILFAFLLFPAAAWAQSVQEQYIQTYSQIAVEEMLRSGVPASITLAQGLLESGSGQSRLATEGNNHFGIKCHKGWTGRSMKHDDDARNECFRVYDSPEQSFRDHSDFLRYRDRYKFLFDLERTDYQGWAYGLKQAGYATDPKYAGKLIKYIEDYNLARFDLVSVEEEAALPDRLPGRCSRSTAFLSCMPWKEKATVPWPNTIIFSSGRFSAITTNPRTGCWMPVPSYICSPRKTRRRKAWTCTLSPRTGRISMPFASASA